MENQRHRLVLITPPFQGHITPMLKLATILHSKGFSITVVHAHFNSPDPSNYPHFDFLPWSLPLSDTQVSTKNVMDLTATLNVKCLSPLKESLLDQIAKANIMHEKIACVIYDGLMHPVDSVARELNLPTLALRITNATNVFAYHVFLQLQSSGSLSSQDSMSSELVPEFELLRFKDFPMFNVTNSDIMQQEIAKTLSIKPSLGFIFNTLDCLEDHSLHRLRQINNVGLFPIGPLHLVAQDPSSSSVMEEDYSCIAWLNKQAKESVLYVSLGSIASWDEKELTEVAWGLANSKQNFLWVIRAGTIDVSNWLQSLHEDVKVAIAKRGCIVKWAPQEEVLAHQAVGGFWSHCGWNSTLESLCEGVPIICQPQFGDQRVNARLLSHIWKVGIEWSTTIERDEIEGAVRRLMVNPEGKEMRQRAFKLKNEISMAVNGGSSYDALNGLVKSILNASV